MKPRKTWLHTAVRAHQAKTLDQLQRTREACDELVEAKQVHQLSGRKLDSLGQAWAAQRRRAAGTQEIDEMYLRYHGFLAEEAFRTELAQQACQEQADAAVAILTQSHAVQRTLEKVARQQKDQLQRTAAARELQSNAEAWLLGRIAGGMSQVNHDAGARMDAASEEEA